MRTALIDTLRYADRLKKAGIEPRQAEAMSRALFALLRTNWVLGSRPRTTWTVPLTR